MPKALLISSATVLALVLCAAAAPPSNVAPDIRTDDVTRFYALYESTQGKPTVEQIKRRYLDRSSPGLIEFAKWRSITSERIAEAIAERPAIFADARRCAALLPAVKARVTAALTKFAKMYPAASFPPVTIAVGRGKPVGIGNSSGVMIGLEAFCAVPVYQSDLKGSFVSLIAHEYAHVQQPAAQVEDANERVLRASLIEGGAELMAELTSGSISAHHLAAATKGREKELETAFLNDVDKKAYGSRWLYNGWGTPEWPGDLGYWVGYRVTKAYCLRSKDKKAAVREIIELRDAKAFLAKSGWYPGIELG